MIGIKFNGIDTYHFNVSFLFLVSFLLHIMDCTVLGTSVHLFEMVHLVTSFMFLSTFQTLSQFVAHTTVFAPSPYRHFNRCGHFCLYFLAPFFLPYYIKIIYPTQVVENCCLYSFCLD